MAYSAASIEIFSHTPLFIRTAHTDDVRLCTPCAAQPVMAVLQRTNLFAINLILWLMFKQCREFVSLRIFF